MSALSLIKNTLSRGGDHLGDLIWWSLADARVDRASLISIWAGAGLSAELLPEPPSAEKAFKGAVREAQVGQPDRLLRLARDDDAEIVFGVIRELRPGNGALSYAQEARITLERDRDTIASDEPAHDLVVDVVRRYQLLRDTHVPDDVRRMIVRALASFAAVTLRPHGGVYWTPAPFAPNVRQLQQAIQRIGASSICIVPVHRTVEAEQTLGAVAKGSLEDELAILRAEVEGFLTSPPDRTSTLERRLGAFEDLRARTRLYRTVLHVEVETLDQQLDRLAATVTQLIDGRNQAA